VRRNPIFQPDGAPLANDPIVGGHPSGGRGKGLPEPTPGWTGLPGSGHLTPLGTPHDPQGQQGMGTPNPPDIPLHQAPELQLGGAQIAVHVVSRLVMYRTKVLLYRTMVLLARLTKVRR
jgi:hypothetical protein